METGGLSWLVHGSLFSVISGFQNMTMETPLNMEKTGNHIIDMIVEIVVQYTFL